MAFPPTPPVFTEQQSLQGILEAECGIAQCEAELFCKVEQVLLKLVPAEATAQSVRVALELANMLSIATTAKERAIAEVINATAAKEQVLMGLPTEGTKPTQVVTAAGVGTRLTP